MTKLDTFFTNLTEVITDVYVETVKITIGDSLNNNRTVSVNQLIRYLRQTKHTKLAHNLQTIYNEVKPSIKSLRQYNNRTDAYDIQEFSLALYINKTRHSSFTKRVAQLIK